MSSRNKKIPYGKPILSNSAEAILPKLWRRMLDHIGVPKSRFENLIDTYVANIFANKKPNPSSTRYNYVDDYLHAWMTWVVFCRGYDILKMTSMSIGVTATFSHPDLSACSAQQTVVYNQDAQVPENACRYGNDEEKKVLKKIFDELQFKSGVNPKMYGDLFSRYKDRQRLPNDPRTLSTAHGNISKETKHPDITWNVFIKLLTYLSVVEMLIDLKVTRYDGLTYNVTMHVVLDPDEYERLQDEAAEYSHDMREKGSDAIATLKEPPV